jgi:spore coat polysaccharide biosynthesis predicted glycosyltransferase SpsG
VAHKKLLYLSWQFGLGHIMRDLAIVRELRAIEPEVEISWMSNPLSKRILEENG